MMPYHPMEDITVLDLADLKGAFCTKVLAIQGARVIKVEPPQGDRARHIPPFAGDEPHLEKSLWFAHYHSDKKSITLNIHSIEGQQLLRELVKHADVLVESSIPGEMNRLGVGYRALAKINPSLVYTSITPFGQSGPRKGYQGTELTTLATGGLTFESGLPDYPPCTAPGFMSYDFAGIYASTGIIIAIIERAFSGKGQHLDLSIQEAIAAATDFIIPAYDNEGIVLTRNGFSNARLVPSGLYKCKDGWVCFMPLRPTQWKAMVEWMENPELLGDPMWADLTKRSQNADILRPIIEEFVGGFTKEGFVMEAQRRHIPATPVSTISDFVKDPHVVSQNFLIPVKHPYIGEYPVVRDPYNVLEEGYGTGQRSPLLGEHNREVYQDMLGLSPEELIALKAVGAI